MTDSSFSLASFFVSFVTLFSLGMPSIALAQHPSALSETQKAYESFDLEGGSATLFWNLPLNGEAIDRTKNFFEVTALKPLSKSPQTGPQIQSSVRTSLSPNLDVVVPLSKSYFLVNGQIKTQPENLPHLVSYSGREVRFDYLADDGETIVQSTLFTSFVRAPLSGLMSASPNELISAERIPEWILLNQFKADSQWQTGAAYLKRKAVILTDTYTLENCASYIINYKQADKTSPVIACANGKNLDSFFPATMNLDGKPYEENFLADGTITTVQGLRMWVANNPISRGQQLAPTYRVYFEMNGNVYQARLMKGGTSGFSYRPDGTAKNFNILLNQAALESIKNGLFSTTTSSATSAAVSIPKPPTIATEGIDGVDLFKIGGHGINGSLAPQDLRNHYHVPRALSGTGQTVLVIDSKGILDPLIELNKFSAYNKLPLCNSENPCFEHKDFSPTDPNDPNWDSGDPEWDAEVALDIDMVHAVAPGAKIVLITLSSFSTDGIIEALNYAGSLPNIAAVSMSFGSPVPDLLVDAKAIDVRLKDLQSQGMIFFASAGDNGRVPGDYPSSSIYVTSVGGTRIHSVTHNTKAKPLNETAWQYTGGGESSFTPMPAWQAKFLGLSLDNSAGTKPLLRRIPDVSAVADFANSPLEVYFQDQWHFYGGTSASSPIWAGFTALLSESMQKKGRSLSKLVSATDGGFNGLLYQIKASPAGESAFFDVTAGSNNLEATACPTCDATPGYDEVTGLGVPNIAKLFSNF